MKRLFDIHPMARSFLAFLTAYAFFEVLSFHGFLYPPLSSALFFVAVGVTAWFAAVRPGVAMLILLGELFVGSQGGYLFAYGTPDDGLQVSLRIGLFMAVFLGWMGRMIAAIV